MDYRANCHKSLQLRNKTEFYNKSINPNEVLSSLLIHLINWFLSFSIARLSSSLQSDGCFHSKLMEEYSNGGVVNEEDLPPIITLPCPIRVLIMVSSIVPCIYLFILYLCHSSLHSSFILALHAH